MSGQEAATSHPEGPHAEYIRRRAACQEQVELLTRRDQWIGRARLANAFALISWNSAGFVSAHLLLSPFWLAVPAAAFFWLLVAYIHDRTRPAAR